MWYILIPAILIGLLVYYDTQNDKTNKEFQIGSCRYLTKIKFENHTYVYLRNTWSGSGDRLLHDPDCECFKIGREK